jgi:hypothetical protein
MDTISQTSYNGRQASGRGLPEVNQRQAIPNADSNDSAVRLDRQQPNGGIGILGPPLMLLC